MKQDKQKLKTAKTTQNNIVNKIKSSIAEEHDNESDLQLHNTAIGNRKNQPYSAVIMKLIKPVTKMRLWNTKKLS